MRVWLMDSAKGVERLRLGEVADHRNVYYFTPTIRVPLRAPQAEAKRANASK